VKPIQGKLVWKISTVELIIEIKFVRCPLLNSIFNIQNLEFKLSLSPLLHVPAIISKKTASQIGGNAQRKLLSESFFPVLDILPNKTNRRAIDKGNLLLVPSTI